MIESFSLLDAQNATLAMTGVYRRLKTKKAAYPVGYGGARGAKPRRNATAKPIPLEVMQVLDLPPFDHKIRQNSANIPEIWDELRRKYVVLTPEEWVRQHVAHYLMTHLGYPRGLLSLERGHRYNQRQKRTDLVALGPDGRPLLLVECKRPTVSITPAVAQQVATYNQTMRAPYLLVTNGLTHYCWRVDFERGVNERLADIPTYAEASAS